MFDFESELKEYNEILLTKPEGQIGREYLKSRKINKSTAIEWEMGYCPVGYTPEIYKNSNIKYQMWRKMWGRVTFGIRDSNGELVSISGRKIIDVKEREKNPKYDHYPFNARSILFGLYMNKKDIFNNNIGVITEGQLDVIMAWQSGIKIVTSSFGAHGGENHLINLYRYTDNIFVIYDNDNAGRTGVEKIFDSAKQLNIKIKSKCPFKEGEDLDGWLKAHSKEDFYQMLKYDKNQYLIDKINKMKSNIK